MMPFSALRTQHSALSFRKYWTVYALYWQENLAQRASFFMDRFRALVVMASFYYLWTSLLRDRPSFAGYTHAQMITYLFGMNVLRSLVFAGRSYELAYEINHGHLSNYLLKPINFIYYTFFKELAEKSINLVSSICEITGLLWFFHMPFQWPTHSITFLLFLLSMIGAVLLYFLMSFAVGCWGFWTAESGGPRFLLELFLEFTAGAFFPLDVLPPRLQSILSQFPSPYLVYFPLQIFLEKIDAHQILIGFSIQMLWVFIFYASMRVIWSYGLRHYSAEGG